MYLSSRMTATSRKQTSVSRANASRTTTRFEADSPSGNETDGGSAELLDISTSREDLSRGASRCSCHSGESSNLRNDFREVGSRAWSNLRLEFDNNGTSDDEQLKEELLRIFDRERIGLENYFKQKTESILQNYRRKQYEWEENVRLEKTEFEKNLSKEKFEVQQNYISEMTKMTQQFNQERMELEVHYKKQINELSRQFEMRKKEMDETITRERTELKQRLEVGYQSMLTAQRSADEQRFSQQKLEAEESYKKRILDLEQKLKEAFSEGEFSGLRLQSQLEAKFEKEKAALIGEWRKRVELLELELGKDKERSEKEEYKAGESHKFLKAELVKKEDEVKRLCQVVETLKVDVSKKEDTAREFELLQHNMFIRGTEALPGKLREDFEQMLTAHREELERTLRKEREELETKCERRSGIERETFEKQLKVERERMSLEVEKERDRMKRAVREKEDNVREEMRRDIEKMKSDLEKEREKSRNQVRGGSEREGIETGVVFLKEKDGRGKVMEEGLKKALDLQEEDWRLRNERERQGFELRVANQKMEHTKHWVEGQRWISADSARSLEDNRGLDTWEKRSDVLYRDEGRSESNRQLQNSSDIKGGEMTTVNHHSNVDEKNATNVTMNVDNGDKNGDYGLKQENEGLKAKVAALQENIDLHVCYKKEASEEIERLRKANKELKVKLQEMEETLKDYEERLEDDEEKIKEYEEICEDYERCLNQCREKIFVVEKDRNTSTVVRETSDEGRRSSSPIGSKNDGKTFYDGRGIGTQDGRKMRNKVGDEKAGRIKVEYQKWSEESVVVVLQTEKEKLERVVQELENKILLLEKKISEISIATEKKEDKASVSRSKELAVTLERTRRQNRDLVKKVKDQQIQLQGLVDKLQKEKKKVTVLQTEYRSFKSMHQAEIKELQEKLEYSGNVISRLQSATAESSATTRLQEEITAISRMMMEERLNDQMLMRARSIEEVEKLRDLDREKCELERKLQDVRTALDGYSERLRNKVSHADMTGSQHSLNSVGNVFFRDRRLSKAIQALEESQRRSLRQNERLLHEKTELQSLIGRLCKSQEDLRGFGGSRLSLTSCGSSTSSMSSSSSSSFVLMDSGKVGGVARAEFSSTFSVFD